MSHPKASRNQTNAVPGTVVDIVWNSTLWRQAMEADARLVMLAQTVVKQT